MYDWDHYEELALDYIEQVSFLMKIFLHLLSLRR